MVCARTNKQSDINLLQHCGIQCWLLWAESKKRVAIRLLGFITAGIIELAREFYMFLSGWAPFSNSVIVAAGCLIGYCAHSPKTLHLSRSAASSRFSIFWFLPQTQTHIHTLFFYPDWIKSSVYQSQAKTHSLSPQLLGFSQLFMKTASCRAQAYFRALVGLHFTSTTGNVKVLYFTHGSQSPNFHDPTLYFLTPYNPVCALIYLLKRFKV